MVNKYFINISCIFFLILSGCQSPKFQIIEHSLEGNQKITIKVPDRKSDFLLLIEPQLEYSPTLGVTHADYEVYYFHGISTYKLDSMHISIDCYYSKNGANYYLCAPDFNDSRHDYATFHVFENQILENGCYCEYIEIYQNSNRHKFVEILYNDNFYFKKTVGIIKNSIMNSADRIKIKEYLKRIEVSWTIDKTDQ